MLRENLFRQLPSGFLTLYNGPHCLQFSINSRIAASSWPTLPEKRNKMPSRFDFLSSFTLPTFLFTVHRHFLSPRPTSWTSLDLNDIHRKPTSVGNQSNYSVQAAGNFSEQLVGDVAVKRRNVAGVDQEDLVDPEKLADPDSLFFEINGVRIHHKICHHEANEDDKEEAFRGKVGLPTILLHGFGASVFSWGRIMKPLACLIGSKVLAFDRPAFGLTSRKSYIKNREPGAVDDKPLNPYSTAFSVLATLSFIDMLGAGKAILMGHSAGSLVAVDAYFESPEKVAALILVAPAIFAPLIMKKEAKGGAVGKRKKAGDGDLDMGAVENPFSRIWHGLCKLCGIIAGFILGMLNKMTNMVSSFSAKVLASLIRSAFGIMLVRIVMDKFGVLAIRKSWYDASKITDDVLQGYTKPLRAKGWDSALLEFTIAMLFGSTSKPKSKPPLSKRLSEIKCPVLIITGDTDRIVPSWNAQRLAQAIPGSTVEVIRNCGHLPHEEKVEEFLSAVEKFLYRTFGAKERQFTEVAT
ncbi:uncharacterized protein LOC110102181 isoform X2 [Dendrobium catenatum]|uniref:AB hydrolase-1 domain-containing protein n=1 Tax=Dendrobium catenatum TaxID=906689 RepID=A0A2I0XBZ9_9ASPA|nr:uncharacterized protein LOC110102181 isoform X1 [Dendrobium catenatum]XP_028547817.1 uncharacterized protein LOC110102181 isoform X2 [Dendrobium catenatum]PKU85431.1 hypothetical protein MA16_Dca003170 [Dendrobium catenatum]